MALTTVEQEALIRALARGRALTALAKQQLHDPQLQATMTVNGRRANTAAPESVKPSRDGFYTREVDQLLEWADLMTEDGPDPLVNLILRGEVMIVGIREEEDNEFVPVLRWTGDLLIQPLDLVALDDERKGSAA